MKWSGFSLVVVLAALLPAAGCGGGGDAPPDDPALQQLQECTGDALTASGGVFNALFDLLAMLEDPGAPPPGNVIFDPGTGSFTIGADLDDDGFTEAIVEGTLTTASNLDDGFDPGESLTLAWQIGAGVPVSGSGSFTVALLSALAARITGALSVSGTASCAFEVSAFDFTIVGDGLDAIPSGTMDYTITSGSDTMAATMVFDATRTVDVTAVFRGQTIHFTMDLETGRVL